MALKCTKHHEERREDITKDRFSHGKIPTPSTSSFRHPFHPSIDQHALLRTMPSDINAESAAYCFVDLDFGCHRSKHAIAAAFVDATDSRYGFSSKDLRLLGGSELSRVPELIASDHEWSSRAASGVEIGPPPSGCRIILKLHWETAPLACENFATLCSNGSLRPGSKEKRPRPVPIGESGKPLTYRGSVVHRIVPGFIMQSGDIIFGNGSGGESIYQGKKFKDERAGLNVRHDRRGILSMGNSGKNSNTSQWFITFKAAPQCDGKHVVFGEVVSGWEVLDAAEQHGTASGEPDVRITVTDCGVWVPLLSSGCGYWFDKPNAVSYSGVSPVFMVRPRVALVAPNSSVLEKFAKYLGGQCSLMPVKQDDYEGNVAPKVLARLSDLLASFAVDVVIVAPACKTLVMDAGVLLPAPWTDNNIHLEEVFLEAKPVDALAVVRTKSWLASKDSWHMQGAT